MTTWQDTVLAASVLALNIALVPSLWGRAKPRVATCLLTALALAPQILVFLSLSLWYSLAMVIINISLWVTLAGQSMYLAKHPKKKHRRA
jgi:hypothetical protein